MIPLSKNGNGKRILFFNVIPLPHSIDIQEQLEQDGYTIDFWYLKDLTTLYPWQSLDKKIIYHIYKGNIQQFFKVMAMARKSNLVIITGWHSVTHILLALFCKITGKPYSFWLDVPEKPAPGFKTKLKQWFMNMADALFVTGKTGIDFFVQEYGAQREKCYDFPYLEVKHIPAGINIINEERNKALLNGDKIKLLISNRFLKRKGYSAVLDAFKKLPAADLQQLDITILGTGTEQEMYQQEFQKLSAAIHLKGWVEYNDYLDILGRSDVYIHASIHEPYGIPPMDAMRFGKLVIGSKGVMSCMDRIENGVNGYLFDIGNGQALADILIEIISNKQLIYSKGKAAFNTSMEYGYKHNRKAIDALIEK